jgi:hypothetical protein
MAGGIIAAALAGGGEGLGKGLESQGKAWTEKQHQDALAEAQAIRAQSLAELTGKIQTKLETDVRQPFQREQNEAQRTSAEGIHAADRSSRATENAADRASRESEGASDRQLRGRQLDQQARQIDAGMRQVDIAVQKGQLELEAAQRLKGMHEQYLAAMAAGDATQADSIADQIYTLAGKDKFTPLMGRDEMGQPVFMGGFNTRTGERGSARQHGPQPENADPLGLRSKFPSRTKPIER